MSPLCRTSRRLIGVRGDLKDYSRRSARLPAYAASPPPGNARRIGPPPSWTPVRDRPVPFSHQLPPQCVEPLDELALRLEPPENARSITRLASSSRGDLSARISSLHSCQTVGMRRPDVRFPIGLVPCLATKARRSSPSMISGFLP